MANVPAPPPYDEIDPFILNEGPDPAWQEVDDDPERRMLQHAIRRINIEEQNEQLAHWNRHKEQIESDRIMAEGIAAAIDGPIAAPFVGLNNGQAPAHPHQALEVINNNLAIGNGAGRRITAPRSARRIEKDLQLEVNRKTGACCVKSAPSKKNTSSSPARGKPTMIKGSNKMPKANYLFMT